eukprot:scaffold525571_cov20-Prasinocladus_malaysianus.AAC.1
MFNTLTQESKHPNQAFVGHSSAQLLQNIVLHLNDVCLIICTNAFEDWAGMEIIMMSLNIVIYDGASGAKQAALTNN